MQNEGSVKEKKRWNVKVLIAFLIFEFVFSAITAPLIVYYGPFDRLKKIVVGAAMSSFSHQYLATTFLTTGQINKILYSQPASNTPDENLGEVSTKNRSNKIECEKIEGRKFDGYILVIQDPTRVKVGYSKKIGVQGEKTSQIAKEYNAIAAINAGGFTDKSQNSKAIWSGTGAFPEGIVIADGKLVYPQGKINEDKKINNSIAGITDEGLLVIGKYSIAEMKKMKVQYAVSFGPPLIVNGVPQENINNQGTAPRTAIGQRKDGSTLLLVVDGRQALKMGAIINDIKNVMLQEGAYNAINLDGGASSTIYYQGHVLNNPSDKFGERPIPTIFYVEE
jgi:exopolysaccharide biosynthesis protein